MFILDARNLDSLLATLRRRGYSVIAPKARDGAIVLDQIESSEDLPRGWTDEQGPAHYALLKRNDEAYFSYVVGPTSWKRYLYPPRLCVLRATRVGKGFEITPHEEDGSARYAFLGVRSCELHAIALQDQVFNTPEIADAHYRKVRQEACIIAVNCVESRGDCFCVSMKTGPRALGGFDLSLTEIVQENRHHFVVETGSPLGETILSELPHREASAEESSEALAAVSAAAHQVGHTLETDHLPKILNERFEDPHWDEVAKRCLACGNCTLVCPTCFCSTVEDVTDLSSEHAERWRRWDSCFTADFTRIAGGNIRMSTRTRYRQWLMHKLAHWVDQFGAFGCVGCGRCITWCPVGIDITAEAKALRTAATQQTLRGDHHA
jgi:sulfhydrogenase subunit beta (sulfur reductase)